MHRPKRDPRLELGRPHLVSLTTTDGSDVMVTITALTRSTDPPLPRRKRPRPVTTAEVTIHNLDGTLAEHLRVELRPGYYWRVTASLHGLTFPAGPIAALLDRAAAALRGADS